MEKMPKVRKTWKINPRTRVKPSKKIYSRKKLKTELKKLEKEIFKDLSS